jgi:hypothetical protein
MRRAAFLLGFLLLASSAAAQFNTIWGVTTGQFNLWGLSVPQPSGTNTVLTYNAGALTWAAGGSGGSPGGTGSELQYRSGASTFGAVTGSSVSGGGFTLFGGISLTKADSSALTDLLINPAVKTSGNLLDLQIGGVDKFNVTNIGSVNMQGTLYAYNLAPSGDMYFTKATTAYFIPEIAAATASTELQILPAFVKTPTSGTEVIFAISPTYNEASGTAANTDLLINRTETAIGSGVQNFIEAQVGSADRYTVDHFGNTTITTPNGATTQGGWNSELLTIAAAATTDTSGNLLPANSYIESVVVRVTTVIPTAATFTVGDATIPGRFATGVAVAAGTTAVGLIHVDQTGTSGPRQTAAAKVRITPNLTPGAATGVVRITVFYRTYTAPTS